MLDFKNLEHEDRLSVKKFFNIVNDRYSLNGIDITCDLVFGTTYFWKDYYKTKYCIYKDSLILQITNGGIEMYSSPLGDGDFSDALSAIREYSHKRGKALYFCFVPEYDLHYFNDAYSLVFATEEPDWYDYVYNFNDLVDLSGRRYHRQKNNLNKYVKNHPDARFVSINKGNTEYVRKYAAEWNKRYSDNSEMSKAEEEAIYLLLDNWGDNTDLNGGFIITDEGLDGFTIGETVGNTVYIHIEKADHESNGAYQFLSTEYLRSIKNDSILFVNREEDMGIEGLRRSKQSLHPVKKLKKYTLYCC